jgi:hypothetical protein
VGGTAIGFNDSLGPVFDDAEDVLVWAFNVSTCLPCLIMAVDSGLVGIVESGPATVAELAAKTALPEDKVQRIVTFLGAHELLTLEPDGRVAPNARTARMREYAACLKVAQVKLLAGSQFLAGLQQGKTPYEAYYGQPVFEHFKAEPELGAVFGEFMGFRTARVLDFLHANHRFEPFEVAVDVGGSFGDLLLSVLEHYPGTRGVLFDLPNVLAQAEPAIRASKLGDRVKLAGGNFFEAAPAGDLYLLKQILHDWTDAECVRILSAIRRAILPGGRVAVIDHLLSETPAPSEGLTTDIAMMIWSDGHERKRSQFEALFAESGFRLGRVTENPQGLSVIEAVPA